MNIVTRVEPKKRHGKHRYGKERGIGIIFIICGLSLFSISIEAFLNKNITSIDSKIPDVN